MYVSSKIKLADKIDTNIPDVFDLPNFRIIIEQHLQTLIEKSNNQKLELTPQLRDIYIGNFHGLLYHLNVPPDLHWVVTRMNGMDSTLDFNGELEEIVIPDTSRLNRLRELFNTVHNI